MSSGRRGSRAVKVGAPSWPAVRREACAPPLGLVTSGPSRAAWEEASQTPSASLSNSTSQVSGFGCGLKPLLLERNVFPQTTCLDLGLVGSLSGRENCFHRESAQISALVCSLVRNETCFHREPAQILASVGPLLGNVTWFHREPARSWPPVVSLVQHGKCFHREFAWISASVGTDVTGSMFRGQGS